MSLLTNKRILIAKIESVYGTDPVPTGANAVLISELTIAPLAATAINRNNIRPYLGRDLDVMVGEHVTIDFKVEMAGSGTAGTAPAYGQLLRACGFSETISAGVDVQYSPVSASFESISMYFNIDGQLHKITGARGTVAFDQANNTVPHYAFKFTGLYNAPSSVAPVTPVFTSFTKPVASGVANTTGFTLQGWAGSALSLNIDIANTVAFHQTLTASQVIITQRAAAAQLVAEAPALSVKNFFTDSLVATLGALSIQHGQTAGNIVKFDAPNVQISTPKYGDANGIVTIDCALVLTPSTSGNDELKITVK